MVLEVGLKMSRIYTSRKSLYDYLTKVWKRNEIFEYQEIVSSAFYKEKSLENSVLIYLNQVLPNYHCIPFKLNIYDPDNERNKQADLALIRKDLKEWFVIEVELEGHQLKEVSEQVESFFKGEYNSKHVDYILEKSRVSFDRERLNEMVSNVPVKLLVIVDEILEEWETELEQFQCKVCAFQIYNDKKGDTAYRLKGPYPDTYTDFCSCKIELYGYLELFGKVGKEFCRTNNLNNGDEVNITYLGKVMKWKRVDDRDSIYLEPIGPFPLTTTKIQYILTYNDVTKNYKII